MKSLIALLSLFSVTAVAVGTDPNLCRGHIFNNRTHKESFVVLKPSKVDVDIWAADLGHYGFATDKSASKTKSRMGMVIYDNNTNNAGNTTAGWWDDGSGNGTQITETKLFAVQPDGSRDEITLNCYR